MKLVFASFEFEFGRDARGKSLFQIVRAKMANSIWRECARSYLQPTDPSSDGGF